MASFPFAALLLAFALGALLAFFSLVPSLFALRAFAFAFAFALGALLGFLCLGLALGFAAAFCFGDLGAQKYSDQRRVEP